MKNNLLKLAFISSPIIAMYGIAPIFLYKPMGLAQIIVSFSLLSLLIFSFWLYNIFLLKKISGNVKRIVVSYFTTLSAHLLLVFLIPYLLIPSFSQESESSNFLFYAIAATMAINTMILVMINFELLKRKKDRAETENQILKVENLEAQKRALLQQLHPHFLFNTLSTLKSLIGEDPAEAENYSVKLSEFLRYSIQNNGSELATLAEELQFTKDYLELQKVRFGDAFNCSINIPDNILNNKIPVFALQTLAENAIKHNGFTDKKPLAIKIIYEGEYIKVWNNKIPKPLITKSGTGLKNLNERYKLSSGKEIEVIEDETQFMVLLNLATK